MNLNRSSENKKIKVFCLKNNIEQSYVVEVWLDSIIGG